MQYIHGMKIDLNLLGVFEAVYQARSLTAAGERLGLSQPAVSHALARLRHVFKDPLFVRTPRGVTPTALAEEIAPRVAEGLAIIRASFEPRRFEPRTSTRLFTLGMADIGEVVQLPPLMKAIAAEAPNVRLRTMALPPAQARAALAEGHMDIALTNVQVKMPLHQHILGTPGYATVVSADHPTIRGKLTLAQFRKARHLLVRPIGAGIKHGETIERALRSVGAQIALQVGHFFPVGAIVAQSDLVATVPWGLARTLQGMLPLRMFKPPIPLPIAHVAIMWHERFHREKGNAWLREIFIREMQKVYRLPAAAKP